MLTVHLAMRTIGERSGPAWYAGSVTQQPRGVSSMARKRVKTVQATQPVRTGRPVRLDLTEKDHERLDKQAKKRGLNKASTARMIILAWLEEQEGGSK